MKESLQALLNAHVEFELNQWHGEALQRRLQVEAKALWQWLEKLPLSRLADRKRSQDALRRLALELPLPAELAETIAAMAQQLLALESNRKTTVSEVLDQEMFEEAVELFAGLEEARMSLIRGAADNPLYSALAAELIYNGIRDYLFSDQALLKRIPGLASLVSVGSSAVNRGAPGLEAQVEKRIRAFIQGNLARTLENSEEFLLAALTPERIRALGDKLWQRLAERPLALDHVVTDDGIDALVTYGHRLWGQLRETEYLAEMLDAGVDQFFELHGEDSVASLLERIGLGADTLAAEATRILPPLVEVARDSGYLEALLRRRLEPFYQSRAARDALPD